LLISPFLPYLLLPFVGLLVFLITRFDHCVFSLLYRVVLAPFLLVVLHLCFEVPQFPLCPFTLSFIFAEPAHQQFESP
jgi:uncharacterized protein YqhQ